MHATNRLLPWIGAAVVLLALTACDPRVGPATESPNKSTPAESSAPQISVDSPKIQTLAENKCGRCHVGTRDSAIPAALEIFDLSKSEWWSELSEDQLELFPSQFREMGDGLDESDFDLVESWVSRVKENRSQ